MGTRVMGTVGVRRNSTGNKGGAFRARASDRPPSVTSLSQPFRGRGGMKSEEPERGQVHDPAREQVVLFPFRHQSERIRLRYHIQAGTKGEALGYMTARNALFLATSSMLPLGTSLILEAAEEGEAPERQTITGKVTAICPGADEFGFPPGVGLCVTEGLQVLHGFVMSGGTQPGY